MRQWIPKWAMVVLVGIAVVTVWLRLSIIRTTYEIGQLDRLIRNATQEQEKLELEIAKMKSPARLKMVAKERYQLRSPSQNQVIYLRSSGRK